MKPEDRRKRNRRRGWAVTLIVVLMAAAGIGIFVSHQYNNPYEDGFNYGASWAGLIGPHNGFPGCSEYDMIRYAHDPNDAYGAWRLGCVEGSDDYHLHVG